MQNMFLSSSLAVSLLVQCPVRTQRWATEMKSHTQSHHGKYKLNVGFVSLAAWMAEKRRVRQWAEDRFAFILNGILFIKNHALH